MTRVFTGVVRHGDARGRTLGFPTANLPVTVGDGSLRDGVYAGWVNIDGLPTALAAISVGHRPTYYGPQSQRLLEAHLIDVDADLYGRSATVWLSRRLRPQRTFRGSAELVEQLHRDVRATRAWAGLRPLGAPRAPLDDVLALVAAP